MTESIIDFLSECPVLLGKKINVNYLDGESSSYSLENVPCEPVLRRYADGGMLCQRKFVLAMRKDSSLSMKRNLSVQKECEEIRLWLGKQTSEGRLPCYGNDGTAVSFEMIKDFGVVQTASMDMRYEAVLKFVFYVGK